MDARIQPVCNYLLVLDRQSILPTLFFPFCPFDQLIQAPTQIIRRFALRLGQINLAHQVSHLIESRLRTLRL